MNIIFPLFALLLPARCASAQEASELKIYSPAVEYQEKELEYVGFFSGKGASHQQGHAMSAAYSPTSYWRTEVYEVLHQDPSMAMVADTIEWENVFQLTNSGQLWADAGLISEFEIAQQAGNPHSFKLGPLLEKQVGSEVLTLDLPLEWKFGPNYVPGTGFSYAARYTHLLNPYFSPAVEAFGEPGIIGRWQRADTQTHSIGPAFLGTWRVGTTKGKLVYSVAGLRGLSTATPDWTVVWRLEYEF